mgnify:CR=1 FL=1
MLVVLLGALPYFIPAPDAVVDKTTTEEWQSKLTAWKTGKPDSSKLTKKKSRPQLLGEEIREDGSTTATEFPGNRTKSAHAELFPFDPNHLSENGWRRLGVPDKVIRTIFNYLNKGGQFRKPEDIARIYGMRAPDVKRLSPWVRIVTRPGFVRENKKMNDDAKAFRKAVLSDSSFPALVTTSPIRRKKYAYIDINTADTSAGMSFPGIGSRLAFRIVQYRDKLGGFHSTEQVGETWALPDSTFQKIKPWLQCNTGIFRKLLINTACLEELCQHPYLRWQLANVIVQYRQQHGPFRSAADLQQIILITPLLITKIAPYIEY